MKPSYLEATFEVQLKAHKLTDYTPEYQFCPDRKWRFDFCFEKRRLAIEIEGGTRLKSRHTSCLGFHNDCDKYNRAAFMGWRVLRFDAEHVKSGEAINLVADFLSDQNRDT